MKEIKLTQGKVALVDDEDFEYLNQFTWYYHKSGYASRTIYIGKKKTQSMHTLINQTPLGFETDHIDGNKLNNQKSNLRTATKSQNQFNKSKTKANTSGYKGVHWHKFHKKYAAKIGVDGKRFHLGYFNTAEEASAAYEAKAKTLFGEFYRKC